MTDQKTENFRGANPYHNLLFTLKEIQNKNYDFILATGDISEKGSLESYRLVKEALQTITVPVHFIPGNHDIPHNMFSVLNQFMFPDSHSFDFLNWSLYYLDTIVDNKHHGYVSPEKLNVLSLKIENSSAANIGIVMHHQPTNVGTPLIDKFNITNSDILIPFVNRHDRLKTILFGHVHNDYNINSNGIIFSSAPATCFQFKKECAAIDIDYNFGYKEYIFTDSSVDTQIIWLSK